MFLPPRSSRPFNCSRTTEFHQPLHFDEELHPPPYGGRRDGFGGRGMRRHFEEVSRPQARHGKPLYDDYEHVLFVANRGRGQGDQTLDRMKWKLPRFRLCFTLVGKGSKPKRATVRSWMKFFIKMCRDRNSCILSLKGSSCWELPDSSPKGVRA
ncbi:hypothetical protein M9H77_02902 [Catharanthus roseus]|uniref:Uncharacterized protein n=1 Tax=Catharanthus roseus TaxID=4058 RepID=A0ACC0CA55_CATRO|nr:hypothetical protein M9H77_02902 [Catharanthus roseus]